MKRTLIAICLVCALLPAWAQTSFQDLRASLITCSPGPEVYELCGHEAIRIQGTDVNGLPVDSVWNYGVFDFNSPNFLWRFCKGETDYILASYPFAYFLPEYIQRGSIVTEQVLNLSQPEVYTLRKLLQINALPKNRVYRYNYVRDNCSTRCLGILEAAVHPRQIVLPDTVAYGTFRKAMRHYHRNYPWYQFGIDLALGGGIDVPVTTREETFVPMMLALTMQDARFADSGAPVVNSTSYLTPDAINARGEDGAVLPPTPALLTPMAAALLLLAITVGVAWWQWRRQRICKWWNALFFLLLGLGGCVIWFLVFVSTHDSTSPNMLSLWLNPLQLTVPLLIWSRRTRQVVTAWMTVCTLVMVVLTAAWPLQAQVAPPAVFPLWAATLILSAGWVLIRYKSH